MGGYTRFQIVQRDAGVPDRPWTASSPRRASSSDLACKLVGVVHPRKLPVVLSREEVTPQLENPISIDGKRTRKTTFAPSLHEYWASRFETGRN